MTVTSGLFASSLSRAFSRAKPCETTCCKITKIRKSVRSLSLPLSPPRSRFISFLPYFSLSSARGFAVARNAEGFARSCDGQSERNRSPSRSPLLLAWAVPRRAHPVARPTKGRKSLNISRSRALYGPRLLALRTREEDGRIYEEERRGEEQGMAWQDRAGQKTREHPRG